MFIYYIFITFFFDGLQGRVQASPVFHLFFQQLSVVGWFVREQLVPNYSESFMKKWGFEPVPSQSSPDISVASWQGWNRNGMPDPWACPK